MQKKKRPKTDKDNFNGKINAWRIAMNHSLVKFKMEKKHTDTHFLPSARICRRVLLSLLENLSVRWAGVRL